MKRRFSAGFDLEEAEEPLHASTVAYSEVFLALFLAGVPAAFEAGARMTLNVARESSESTARCPLTLEGGPGDFRVLETGDHARTETGLTLLLRPLMDKTGCTPILGGDRSTDGRIRAIASVTGQAEAVGYKFQEEKP